MVIDVQRRTLTAHKAAFMSSSAEVAEEVVSNSSSILNKLSMRVNLIGTRIEHLPLVESRDARV